MRLRLAGEGEVSEYGGEPGDLYIFLEVEPHATLVRNGNDLETLVTIPFTKAILGHELPLRLVDEEIVIEIPPGTQPGDRIRIDGKGIPYVGRGGSGDLVVEVRVTLPIEPGDAERALLEQLDAVIGDDRKRS